MTSKEKRRSKRNSSFDTNTWNQILEKKIEEMGNTCSVYRWLHEKNQSYLSGQYEKLQFYISMIGLISGTGGIGAMGVFITNDSTAAFYVQLGVMIITTLLSFAAAGLGIYLKSYDYSGKIQRHEKAKKDYADLYYIIQSELEKKRGDRKRGVDFQFWIVRDMKKISGTEDIDDIIKIQYTDKFGNNQMPDIDGIGRIVVNENTDSPISESINSKLDNLKSRTPEKTQSKDSKTMEKSPSFIDLEAGSSFQSKKKEKLKKFDDVMSKRMSVYHYDDKTNYQMQRLNDGN